MSAVPELCQSTVLVDRSDDDLDAVCVSLLASLEHSDISSPLGIMVHRIHCMYQSRESILIWLLLGLGLMSLASLTVAVMMTVSIVTGEPTVCSGRCLTQSWCCHRTCHSDCITPGLSTDKTCAGLVDGTVVHLVAIRHRHCCSVGSGGLEIYARVADLYKRRELSLDEELVKAGTSLSCSGQRQHRDTISVSGLQDSFATI